ncbi:MAG TPA: 1-(5-phosphoribosyl)-5-[(5-phosphoribosylamino)methylideneamino]imidazole-4-carboxamide isomerase [Acidiphilium sp.]|nr:MAG: 1-(5-phosphoribosyl)-5-[(5-phosphoribosylamino)methylideneamino]imidazole-4-carboxamide isomerase [Acidiphilium sp. 21-60-14]OYV90385.1 MAG: 1-(5-phosphoribosyl)-5-[(5-phosphoribosylamino)methylideneamino]imidazole-4-carboxamide isomerase [Acidiphilium sp. 37-60-79]OZB40483.1 MAG: 1-(5-phosphoribosyl)-5-[(5-phosphoribosylamino)methylideneamino]imidazole-4-carboxamide isomerase [Acidiphilium sp. 34-60-192]HQT88929.1 1-(5-phosphoribosyl)-5-[(5-phosphoribosylamino)methylideneamino]imidazole
MALTLYPAIDLKDGVCVRLARGDMQRATIYAEDPAAQASEFVAAGFMALHVVDLNGAFAGASVNGAAVRAILAAVKVPVQLGGGIRDIAAIESWLSLGIARVILGSVAVKNPTLVREAARQFPGQIIVGIDARDGMVATEGWAETSSMTAENLAEQLEDVGISAIIHTDIARDGMLSGLNLVATEDLARRVTIPVIASGGVAGLGDIALLRDCAMRARNIEGAIIGRALYDGRIDPIAALKLAA